ncbi:GTP 3',8-cyclase MoaA [Asaia bogorensis]|uniref:GTP 3',8-cyclase MoaA n=1 Tax=Asaia bogorensis TaxID=91915 RepID=UPI000EFB8893|nr:GTP 3',8-cyclase MoaA [Asaia bogorensis]
MTGEASQTSAPRDRLGRPWHDLRISVMDRCNFRCPYCMPESVFHDDFAFLAPDARLSFEAIERVARVASWFGVSKLRLTGGEPLLRPDLSLLVRRLVAIEGIDDVALTTNAVLLERHLDALHDAGLTRLTISLDSLDPAIFSRMSGGRAVVETVLAAIDKAAQRGFPGGIKINTVLQRDVNESEILPLVARFRHTGITLRFIEYMDVGTRNHWSQSAVVPSAVVLERIATRWPVEAIAPRYRGEVARRYRFTDGAGEIGFISSVTAPFCGDCSRARLSSDGQIFTCLFATKGTDLRAALTDESDEALRAALRGIWHERSDRYSEMRHPAPVQPAPPEDGHGTGRTGDRKIEMYYIGG